MHKSERGTWLVDTSFEAWIIGRAAAQDETDDSRYYVIKHADASESTGLHDEKEFSRRIVDSFLKSKAQDLPEKDGLPVNTAIMLKARLGFIAILESETSYMGVSPAIAEIALRAMNKAEMYSSETALENVAVEVPQFNTELITVQKNDLAPVN